MAPRSTHDAVFFVAAQLIGGKGGHKWRFLKEGKEGSYSHLQGYIISIDEVGKRFVPEGRAGFGPSSPAPPGP